MDINGLNDLSDMIQLALMACDKPPKALALELKCSLSTVYKAMQGKRTMPISLMQKFAQTNLIAAAGMAMQITGLPKLFRYRKTDRHIQSRLVELKMLDRNSDMEMNKLPELLFNKNSASDLSGADVETLLNAVDAMMERDNAALNLFMELDTRYNLNLVEHMKRARLAATKRTQAVR